MDLNELIRQEVEKEIVRIFKPKSPQLVPFLLQHPNRVRLERNLRLEIFGAELKFGVRMDTPRAKKIVQAGVAVFASIALDLKKKELMSAAERQRLEKEAGREKEAAAWYAEEQKALKSTAISKSMHISGTEAKQSGDPSGTNK